MLLALLLSHIATPSLSDLYSRAELVVVGTVTERSENDATLSIEQVFKGTAEKTVRFSTVGTWRCDTSDAVLGERKLMFLYRDKGTWRIEASGRGRRDPDPKVLSWLTHKVGPSTFTVTRNTCPACPASRAETHCYDRSCMENASDEMRPFVAELPSGSHYIGDGRGEIREVRAIRVGACQARIEVSRCESAECESPELVSSSEQACAGWAPGYETSEPLPASMLHCKERDHDCLVVSRPGFDVQPRATGETLSCQFNERGRLDCWPVL